VRLICQDCIAAMDCFYINLESAKDRSLHIEKNFAACKKPGWTLTRFPAIDKAYVASNNIAGTAKPAEKACFLSHQILMGQHLGDYKSYLILEDDAAFGARTCTLIDTVLEHKQGADWDILFTDVCIANILTMFDLVKHRRSLGEKKVDVEIMNLRGVEFAGSTAYIVNGKSKRKVYDALSAYTNVDLPYDLFLRQLAHRGALNIHSLFPFVTTLSDYCDESQIKAAGLNPIDLAFNMFRKMIWVERNLNRCKAATESFRSTWCRDVPPVNVAGADDEMKTFMFLFASMAAIRG
jgi:GR25 family glycosyltransferase involved in LPS biosynthesis